MTDFVAKYTAKFQIFSRLFGNGEVQARHYHFITIFLKNGRVNGNGDPHSAKAIAHRRQRLEARGTRCPVDGQPRLYLTSPSNRPDLLSSTRFLMRYTKEASTMVPTRTAEK